MLLAGIVGLGVAVDSSALLWAKAAAWLVEHHVLVQAQHDAIVPVPGTAGAGLDLPRLMIAAAVLLALGAVLVSWVHGMRQARPEDLS